MSSVKQYIKNPKFGQGNEPEFLPVGTTGIDVVKNRLLQVERQELNLTIKNSKNYSTLTEAIADVTNDKYKFKGFVLTFNNGTDWVSKRYNGEDASGFANEGNWIDVGGAAGGTQYLDLSMFSGESGILSDEDYQKVVKAYNDKIIIGCLDQVYSQLVIINQREGIYDLIFTVLIPDITIIQVYISLNSDKSYTLVNNAISLLSGGAGTKALTDNGQYVDFAKPTRVIKNTGGGPVTSGLSPNILYKFGERPSLTITLGGGTVGIVNEYMFEFVSGTTPTTLSLPDTIKWSGGNAPNIEANKTYQVSIVNNLAVFASF
nr:MAG TPA: hypothetical protein [Caudoviricetes sp.]